MEKIKNKINCIKNHSFERIMIELILLALLYNVNTILGCILAAIVLLETVFSRDNRNLLCIFIFLSFCDDILILPKLNFSVSRVVLILVFMKLAFDIIKNKRLPNKFQIAVITFFTISAIVEVISIGFSTETVATFINIMTFVEFSMVFDFKEKEKIEELIEKLCYTIVIGVTCSIIYGLATLNFMKYGMPPRTVIRFNGTLEPNFMCMFINLGILGLIAIRDKIKKIISKIIYYILFTLFLCAAFWTASITGLGTLAFCLLLYVIFYRKKWKQILKDFIIIAIIVGAVIGGVKYFKIDKMVAERVNETKITEVITKTINPNGVNTRLGYIITLLKEGQFDVLTSGRTAIVRAFMQASFNRPIGNILLGNGLNNSMVYCDYFEKEYIAHNTFMDFLYNFGVIGFIVSNVVIFYRIIKNRFLNQDISDSQYSKMIKIIRIMILLYSLALTLYTRRMLLVFFLL